MGRPTIIEQRDKLFVESGDFERVQLELGMAYALYTHANEHTERVMEIFCKYMVDYPEIVNAGNALINSFDKFHLSLKSIRTEAENKIFLEQYNALCEIIDSATIGGELWQTMCKVYSNAKAELSRKEK